jgi:hypothetical protein
LVKKAKQKNRVILRNINQPMGSDEDDDSLEFSDDEKRPSSQKKPKTKEIMILKDL